MSPSRELQHVWGAALVINIVVLGGFLLLVAYRIWRWRHIRSSPSVAATAFGSGVWSAWMLSGWVWEMLPAGVKAMSVVGGPGVLMAASFHVLILDVRSHSARRVLGRVKIGIAAASLVLIVMVAAIVAGNATSVDLDLFRFDFAPDPVNTGLTVATVTANIYMAFVLVQLVRFGWRRVDKTPAGRGSALLAVSAASLLIPVLYGGIWRQLVHQGPDPHGLWMYIVPATIGAVGLLGAFMGPPLVLWIHAERNIAQLRMIRRKLVADFPNLQAPVAPGTNRTDLAYEWCSQIQDGLTLTAQRRHTPLWGDEPPQVVAARAQAVARWLAGAEEPNLNCRWLRAPQTVRHQEWVLAIAAAYRSYASDEGLSGRPSALRRWLTMSAMTWRAPSERS